MTLTRKEDSGDAGYLVQILSNACAIVRDADAGSTQRAHSITRNCVALGRCESVSLCPIIFSHTNAAPLVDGTFQMSLDEFWEQTTSFKSGLSELSHTIAVDEGRKLLFAADEYKSYGYNLSQRRLDERRR
ncbi:hypothetical protein IEO21_06817 [Rhodonia placenta]|uniref:Uncharacterized protein n=1 Tax=Rhodonia placenta TaxID=104341 RepID=A0A8H7NZI4_9APHY|nr:hypothetical protein IEO21_06817 [Postia placenta]